ncbi:MAG: hypothetical protein AAFY04_07770 [Pseudomonadota bacterium]
MAAFEARDMVTDDDIRAVAPMALRHRLRKDPLDESDNTARITRIIDEAFTA